MSIEDVEDFCEVCGKFPRGDGPCYAHKDALCNCDFIKVKVVREIAHAQDASLFYAKWLTLRVRPQIGEFLNIDGDCYRIHIIEHVADQKCALIVWLLPDTRTYALKLPGHNIQRPPKEWIDLEFRNICEEMEAEKWFLTLIWWRKD